MRRMCDETRSDWHKKLRERRREVCGRGERVLGRAGATPSSPSSAQEVERAPARKAYFLGKHTHLPPFPSSFLFPPPQVRELKKRQQKHVERERRQREKLLDRERADKELQLKAKVSGGAHDGGQTWGGNVGVASAGGGWCAVKVLAWCRGASAAAL